MGLQGSSSAGLPWIASLHACWFLRCRLPLADFPFAAFVVFVRRCTRICGGFRCPQRLGGLCAVGACVHARLGACSTMLCLVEDSSVNLSGAICNNSCVDGLYLVMRCCSFSFSSPLGLHGAYTPLFQKQGKSSALRSGVLMGGRGGVDEGERLLSCVGTHVCTFISPCTGHR